MKIALKRNNIVVSILMSLNVVVENKFKKAILYLNIKLDCCNACNGCIFKFL